MQYMKSGPIFPYQERVSAFAKRLDRVGMLVFYGSGKTFLSLQWFANIHEQNPLSQAMVLCPKSLIHQWGKEIEKHTKFSYSLVVGTAKQRVELLETTVNIYVINYDAAVVRMTREKKLIENPVSLALRKLVQDLNTVIADESTLLKNSRTKRFKQLTYLFRNIRYRAILTGQVITEKPEDVFAQMLFLDQGETFGRAFWRFRYNYFSPGPTGNPYDWVLKAGAGQQIAERMNQRCICIPKEEIINELPPRRFITVNFKLPSATRELYKKLRKEWEVTFPSGMSFDTQWAVVKSQKLHQMCQGFVYHPDKTYELLHNEKLKWIEENIPLLVQEGPVLIWSNYRVCLDLLHVTVQKLGLTVEQYHGGLTQRERAIREDKFTQGKLDVFVLGTQAAHKGLNLQLAPTAVFFSNGYEAEYRRNAEDRNHRIGSEIHEHVTYFDLVMERTIDQIVLMAIYRKQNIMEQILKYLKNPNSTEETEIGKG